MTTLAVPARTVRPVTFPRVVASEWVKLRSLRSTSWALALALGVMVGIAAIAGWATTAFETGEEVDLVGNVTGGAAFAELVVVVLGVLAVTGEHTTGQVRSTFAAVPSRVPVLLAKSVVVAAVTAVTTTLATALYWAVTAVFASRLGHAVDLADPESARRLLGVPVLLATLALLGLAVGALLRSTAGAVAATLGTLLVVETVLASLPWRPFQVVAPYLPGTASSRLLMPEDTIGSMNLAMDVELSAWQGYGVLVGWVVVLMGVACVLVRRRDA